MHSQFSPRNIRSHKSSISTTKFSKSRSPDRSNFPQTKLSPKILQKKDSRSVKYLPKLENTFEDDLKKLENLTYKNLSARFDWIEIEERLIQLGVQRKLEPIVKNDRKTESVDFNLSRYKR